MDERLRRAVLYPDPPAWLTTVIHGLVHLRGFVIRHLYPRPVSPVELRSGYGGVHRSMERTTCTITLLCRTTSSRALLHAGVLSPGIRRVQGLPIPGDQGQKICPMGYTTPKVGPGRGKKEQKAMEEKVASIIGRGSYSSRFAAA